MSDRDINACFPNEPRWGGVHMNDQVAALPSHTTSIYIVNLQNSWQEGSHWVLLSCLDRKLLYFDPYGYPPTKEVSNWMLATKRPCVFSKVDEQSYSSEACGWFCVFVAQHLLAGWSATDIMKLLGTPAENERILQDYFER